MVDALAGGWIEPALEGGSFSDAAIVAISSLPYAGGEGVEYLPPLCLLRTFRERLFNAPPYPPLLPDDGGEGVRCVNALFGVISCPSVGFAWGVVGLCLLRYCLPILNTLDAPLFILV